MATISDRNIINQLIRNNGRYEDDPIPIAIFEYTHAEDGKQLWSVAYTEIDIHNLESSPFVKDPMMIWERDHTGVEERTEVTREFNSHEIFSVPCPLCGMKCNFATGKGSGPNPGDPCICGHCRTTLMFTEDGGMRETTIEEIEQLPPGVRFDFGVIAKIAMGVVLPISVFKEESVVNKILDRLPFCIMSYVHRDTQRQLWCVIMDDDSFHDFLANPLVTNPVQLWSRSPMTTP